MSTKVMTSRITRMYDGPDALPLGTPPPPHLPAARVDLYGDATDIMRARELFRTRVHPELFEGWHVDLVIDTAHALARASARFVYDCHPCRASWLVTEDANTCPHGHRIAE